ncbi:sugar phosphate isomerase/epimerase family protein [Knoellia subterranea]|nr:TIM barrel protein [Knoellia subterranea]
MSRTTDSRRADEWLQHVGLCSVTLRHLSTHAVVDAARTAGLRRIEWGADAHAPPHDPGAVTNARELTEAAGLMVASYGSYWRAGVSPADEVLPIVRAAAALGAPRIRVWAGDVGTDRADDDTWNRVAAALREACRIARDHGVELALEFHPNTLTDSVDSTLELLDRVGDSTLRTYWQPRIDEEVAPAVEGLRRLLPHVAAVHVFSWWPGAERLRLHERTDLWAAVADALIVAKEPRDLLLEFVPGDNPALLPDEAATLRRLLGSG